MWTKDLEPDLVADADSAAQVGSERRADRWLRAHEGTRPAEP